ncbi:hypothetical protein ACTPEM_24320, partial [Clostridioides difficile]
EIGKSDEWISKHLGMEVDEILRLKQITGLAYLFKDKEFGNACKASNEKVGKIKGDFNDSNLMGNFSNNSELGISGNITENHNKE